jgi:hypothetical protein
MQPLAQLARSYLEAGGYRLLRAKSGFFDVERPAGHVEARRILLWSDDETRLPSNVLNGAQRTEREEQEAALLRSFEHEMREAPGATGCYLVGNRLGHSQHFVTEVTRLLGSQGGIRVPAEFFDASYKIEGAEGRRARSVLGDVLALAKQVRRVPQPFSVRNALSTESSVQRGGDLVAHLASALAGPNQGPKLRFIDGAAGSGKTIAFNALAAGLYGEFIAAKRARQRRARPIVFLPEHLRGKRVGYVDDIVSAVAETDVAELTSPEQFKWLLRNGQSLWMFDGLDEFYAGGSDFFSFVEEALTAPNSRAQFIICVRDSLLNSSSPVRDFIERRTTAGDDVEIYELCPWTADAWQELARLELEGGQDGARSSARVESFVATLKGSKEIAAMAQLPFYCSVLLSHFKNNDQIPTDEIDVLELLVDSMIDREHGKSVVQWRGFIDVEALVRVFEFESERLGAPMRSGSELDKLICRLLDTEAPALLFEIIGGLAHRLRYAPCGNDETSGFTAEDAENFISFEKTANGNDVGLLPRLRTALVRFAFFGPGRKAGLLDFTHEILADYFAARYASLMLERVIRDHEANLSPGRFTREGIAALQCAFAGAIGTTYVFPGSIFYRYFERQLEKVPALRHGLELVAAHGDTLPENAIDFLGLLLGEEALSSRLAHSMPPPLPDRPAVMTEALRPVHDSRSFASIR